MHVYIFKHMIKTGNNSLVFFLKFGMYIEIIGPW